MVEDEEGGGFAHAAGGEGAEFDFDELAGGGGLGEFDADVVGGEGDAEVADGDGGKAAADLGLAEELVFAVGELLEDAVALAADLDGDGVGEIDSLGARALGVSKDVEVGEGEAFDEIDGGGEFVLGFTGEADHNIGAEGGLGHELASEPDTFGVVPGAVLTVHAAECGIAAGLQGGVNVAGDAGRGGHELEQGGGKVHRFDAGQADEGDGSFLQQAAEEVGELAAGAPLAAPAAKVDTGENDFGIAGGGEALGFGDNPIRGSGAGLSADARDDAKGAAIVAAVLDLEVGAGTVASGALDGGIEEFALGEDIADVDFGVVGGGVGGDDVADEGFVGVADDPGNALDLG